MCAVTRPWQGCDTLLKQALAQIWGNAAENQQWWAVIRKSRVMKAN